MEIDQRKYDKLFKQIMERLNSGVVVKQGDIVSMYDVVNSVSNLMGLYNVILGKSIDRTITKLNKNNGYSRFIPLCITLSLPRVVDIANFIGEDGIPYIYVMFTNNKKIVLTGNSDNVRVVSTDFSSSQTIDFVNYNSDIFSIYCGTMLDFAVEFPNTEMAWGKNVNNKMNQTISDGFISCTIRPTEPQFHQPIFSSNENNELATQHNKKHGELYDYLAFYSDEILRKSEVNVNDLNPFIQACLVKNSYVLEAIDFTLTK